MEELLERICAGEGAVHLPGNQSLEMRSVSGGRSGPIKGPALRFPFPRSLDSIRLGSASIVNPHSHVRWDTGDSIPYWMVMFLPSNVSVNQIPLSCIRTDFPRSNIRPFLYPLALGTRGAHCT